MALPTSTVNGATATINGIVYTYNSTKGAWYKQSTASTNVPVTISGTLSVSGNANVGNLGSPTVVSGNSNITVTANGAVSISTNAAVRTTVDANGNVGIKNTSPTHLLDVGDGTVASQLYVYGSVSGSKNSYAAIQDTSGTSIGFRTAVAGTVTMNLEGGSGASYFNGGGNLGVGTASPTTRLSVVSSTNGGINVNDGTVNTILYNTSSLNGTIGTTTNHPFAFYTNNTEKMRIDAGGNLIPSANVTYNLGSATARWSTVYTGDLELSNGIGNYTIVEGEDDLFLYNNRSGKTYRFLLQEVDPTIVPPKKGT